LADKNVRHILGLSGGKDSTALALYLKDKVSDIEYFFCDTHKELPETYVYLRKLEILLGKKIVFLEDKRGFDHWLDVYGGFLPSAQARWCTKQLKILPLEKYVGEDDAIKPVFPFMKDGLVKRDILKIIADSGIGMPEYYSWRSRSGCYFCFFQRKVEWVMLSEIHPDLFEKAVRYEQEHSDGRKYFWNLEESLLELIDSKDQIIADHQKLIKMKKKALPNRPLSEVFDSALDDETEDFCFVCNL